MVSLLAAKTSFKVAPHAVCIEDKRHKWVSSSSNTEHPTMSDDSVLVRVSVLSLWNLTVAIVAPPFKLGKNHCSPLR
jgi:hypothetical protein